MTKRHYYFTLRLTSALLLLFLLLLYLTFFTEPFHPSNDCSSQVDGDLCMCCRRGRQTLAVFLPRQRGNVDLITINLTLPSLHTTWTTINSHYSETLRFFFVLINFQGHKSTTAGFLKEFSPIYNAEILLIYDKCFRIWSCEMWHGAWILQEVVAFLTHHLS